MNLLIATALSGVLAWAGWLVVSVVAFVVSVFLIGLRGYLVPGTPTLTRRYLPERVLAFFAGHHVSPAETESETVDDVERFLIDRGVVEERPTEVDVTLADDVREAWTRAMESAGPDPDVGALLSPVVDVDDASVSVDDGADEFAVAADGDHLGRWPSRAAFVADLTAAAVLADELDGWEQLSRRDQRTVVAGLRLFLDACPTCGGTPVLDERTDDACCRTRTVTVLECTDCDARFVNVTGA